MRAFDLAQEIHNHLIPFILYPSAWEKFKWPKGVSHKTNSWKEIKYFDSSGTKLSPNISQVPTNKGGIYIFIIKTDVIENITNYPIYVGRARYTRYHNLRTRVRKYSTEYIRNDYRPKVVRFIDTYKNYLFLQYLEMTDNKLIEKLEARLIDAILPPFNDSIPNIKYRRAIKAFK